MRYELTDYEWAAIKSPHRSFEKIAACHWQPVWLHCVGLPEGFHKALKRGVRDA